MLRPLTLVFALCLTACAHPAYFPGDLSRNGVCGPILDGYENEWFSEVLYAASEPSLTPPPVSGQVVRFLYLPSFEAQIIVRLNIPATGPVRLTAKKVFGDGRHEPYMVRSRVSKTLSASESARVRDLVASARLSQIPSKGCEGPGMDGETWIIESVEAGRYHYIHRWVPPKGDVRTFGTELARLARWQGDLRD